METIQEMAKEAVCSALYSMEFTRFLGERPDPLSGEDIAYFRLCQDPTVEHVNIRSNPKVVMVSVSTDEGGFVVVECQWLNVSAGMDQALRGRLPLRISTFERPEHEVRSATEAVVLRVLDVFKDVLAQDGLAGPIDRLAPESEAGDPDDEDDMAVSL